MARKCKTCTYRAAEQEFNNCDYFLITGHMRGCPATDCHRYEKGDRISLRKYREMVLKGTVPK